MSAIELISPPISGYFAKLFSLRWVLGRVGYDPCDEWCIDTLLGLPDGLYYHEGQITFDCHNCGSRTEWPGAIEDFEPGHYANVCGGSPRCCP